MASSTGDGRRRALIIGINRYAKAPLMYCENDANDLKLTLESIGFGVSLGINCNREQFIEIITTFVTEIQHTDLIVFYFAGHGKQHEDKNYLLPSDYNYNHLTTEDKHIAEHAVSAQYIMESINDKCCCITIYLFDCCRNFVRTKAMDTHQGLSSMNPLPETLIAFSCAPGEAALGVTRNNRNGIFTENLLKHITTPNQDIEKVLKHVSHAVKSQTANFQKPYRTSSLTEEIFLVNLGSNARWMQNDIVVAGLKGHGNAFNQLSYPSGLYVDHVQTVYVTEWNNHRVVEWKHGAMNGQPVAGGNGPGNRVDQLNCPTDVVVDKERNCLIICDRGNKRVVQWPLHGETKNGQTIISNIACNGLAMDNRGFLYISDTEQNNVKRWQITSGVLEDNSVTVVAGGNGTGNGFHQLNDPYYICVDQDHSVYVSDNKNHRVMKWVENAKEGILVAGGRGQGNDPKQLSHPLGVVVDPLGTVYVSDGDNGRIMRWFKEATQGSVITDGNGAGKQVNQLSRPNGLSFDRYFNLYVVEENNHRVQKLNIDRSSSS